MVQILKEKPCLFVKRPADIGRQAGTAAAHRELALAGLAADLAPAHPGPWPNPLR